MKKARFHPRPSSSRHIDDDELISSTVNAQVKKGLRRQTLTTGHHWIEPLEALLDLGNGLKRIALPPFLAVAWRKLPDIRGLCYGIKGDEVYAFG